MLWSRDARPKVIAELCQLSVPDMGKELGKRWANLDRDQKENYEKMARQERENYMVALSNYTPSKEFVDKQKMAAFALPSPVKKVIDPLTPKKPKR